MSKAYFSRKAVNAEELKNIAGQEHELSDFVLEKIIELNLEQWEHFKENLLDDFDFVSDNTDFQYVDTNGVRHCIGIMGKGGSELIIGNCEGYNYLRYSSYFPDGADLISDYKKHIFPDSAVEQLLTIRSEGKFNMFSIEDIKREALEKGFDELYELLENHKLEYAEFILTGQR